MEGFRCWSEFDGICKNTHAAMPEFLKKNKINTGYFRKFGRI